jgi:ArsR family transcriptional regulator
MKNLSGIFKALADETRLAVLALLFQHQELCVCDFVAVLSISQSKASRHLRYLLNAGLLEDRRAGVWVHYRVAQRPAPAARDVLRAVEQVLAGQDHEHLEQCLADWLADKKRDGLGCAATQRAGGKTAAPSQHKLGRKGQNPAQRPRAQGPRAQGAHQGEVTTR